MARLVLSPEERIGTVLAGKYKFERVLGQGGMGTVFGGTHSWTNRPVAIKVLNDGVASDAGIAERFLWEARAAAEIRHPNVVDVLDMGTGDDGAVYMVLEWLEGESLADVLDRERPMRIDRAVRFIAPIMAALAHAHAAGIVHRDIKPDNIFISKDKLGRTVPKLLDFGVAKVQQRSHGANDKRTETGMVIGTPQYMSPEQAMGDTTVGPAADVWSIGAVLFECVAGRLPFGERTSAALLIALNTQDAPSVVPLAPHLHSSISAVIDRALMRRREQRWSSMTDMLAALVRACEAAAVPIDDATRAIIAAVDPSAASPSLPPLPPETPLADVVISEAQSVDVPMSGFDGPSKRATRPLRPPVEGGSPVTPLTSSADVRDEAGGGDDAAGPARPSGSRRSTEVLPESESARPSTGFSWSGKREKPRSTGRLLAIAGVVIALPVVVVAGLFVAGAGPFSRPPHAETSPTRPVAAPPRAAEPRTPATPSGAAPPSTPPGADHPLATAPSLAPPVAPAPTVVAVAVAVAADAGTIAASAATDASIASGPSSGSSRPRSTRGRLIRTW